MSVHHPNKPQMLEGYAGAFGALDNMPSWVVHSIMLANNRILAAAIIENGGELNISSESVHENLTAAGNVMEVATEDGALTVTVASKDEIIAKPEASPL